jgi:hypothetical protein
MVERLDQIKYTNFISNFQAAYRKVEIIKAYYLFPYG